MDRWLGPLPPLFGTVTRSIATLEPHSGFTTMPKLMDNQARARLICLRQEGIGVVLLSPTNDQRFALQNKLSHDSRIPIKIDLALCNAVRSMIMVLIICSTNLLHFRSLPLTSMHGKQRFEKEDPLKSQYAAAIALVVEHCRGGTCQAGTHI